MGHVVTLCFFHQKHGETDTHRYTKWGHVCDPEDYRTQIHTDTQNSVTYVTRKPILHRDTGSRWSRGSRGVFFGKILFLGHRVTWITLCVFGKFCFWYTWSRWSRWSQCFFKTFFSGSQGHAGHVGHVVFF